MKVEWFRSATVGVTSNSGTSILCDPWLTDGAFLGSWYHFPPLQGFEFQEVLGRPWDAVYVSHLHADHFDRKFLAALARRQPECTVVIPHFAHSWLRRAVESCGFPPQQIAEVGSGDTQKIGLEWTWKRYQQRFDPHQIDITLRVVNVVTRCQLPEAVFGIRIYSNRRYRPRTRQRLLGST